MQCLNGLNNVRITTVSIKIPIFTTAHHPKSTAISSMDIWLSLWRETVQHSGCIQRHRRDFSNAGDEKNSIGVAPVRFAQQTRSVCPTKSNPKGTSSLEVSTWALPGIGGGSWARCEAFVGAKEKPRLQRQFSCSTSDQQHLYRATGTSDNDGLNYSGSLSPLDAGKVFFLISMQLLSASVAVCKCGSIVFPHTA